MKRAALAMIILALAMIGCGCSKPPSVIVSSSGGKCVVDLSSVITVDGHSFVPLHLKGEPSQHIMEILLVLKEFKDKHPGWEVVNWKIQEKTASTNNSGPMIIGLWVDHHPKK